MFTTRHISSRTSLQGAGTSLALPFVEGPLPAAMEALVNSAAPLQKQRPHVPRGVSRDNTKIYYLTRVTDVTAKTPAWPYLPHRSDFLARPGSDRQSWFAFSDLPLNTRDEFAILDALLNIQDERSSRPNPPTPFPHIGFEPHWAETDSLNPIRDLRVDMRQATWIINRAYPFRCIPAFAAKVRLRQEPWFIPNGFHPPVESSPVFAFGLVKTSGRFALLT